MNTYKVTLHDDNDYQFSLLVFAASIQDAREHESVLDSIKRNDMHIVSVRLVEPSA